MHPATACFTRICSVSKLAGIWLFGEQGRGGATCYMWPLPCILKGTLCLGISTSLKWNWEGGEIWSVNLRLLWSSRSGAERASRSRWFQKSDFRKMDCLSFLEARHRCCCFPFGCPRQTSRKPPQLSGDLKKIHTQMLPNHRGHCGVSPIHSMNASRKCDDRE